MCKTSRQSSSQMQVKVQGHRCQPDGKVKVNTLGKPGIVPLAVCLSVSWTPSLWGVMPFASRAKVAAASPAIRIESHHTTTPTLIESDPAHACWQRLHYWKGLDPDVVGLSLV